MPYISPAALLSRYGAEELAQVADRGTPRIVTAESLAAAISGADRAGWAAADQAAITDALAVLQRAIDDAESIVNGHLAAIYSVPLDSVPDSVCRICATIARSFLHGDNAGERLDKDYGNAMKLLAEISAGRIKLAATAENQPRAGGVTIAGESPDRVFTRQARGLC